MSDAFDLLYFPVCVDWQSRLTAPITRHVFSTCQFADKETGEREVREGEISNSCDGNCY